MRQMTLKPAKVGKGPLWGVGSGLVMGCIHRSAQPGVSLWARRAGAPQKEVSPPHPHCEESRVWEKL